MSEPALAVASTAATTGNIQLGNAGGNSESTFILL
jgi:hypothetical protein